MVTEIEITFEHEENKLLYNGHTLLCLHDDDFCNPTILTPLTIVWFLEGLRLIFSILSLNGRITKINTRCWLETEHVFNHNI